MDEPDEKVRRVAAELVQAAALLQTQQSELTQRILSTLQGLADDPAVPPHSDRPMMSEWEMARLEYFQKHAMPVFIEQLKFRGLGLQFFLAGQAVLINTWVENKSFFIALLGLLTCSGLLLWEARIRDIMGQVHEWGREAGDSFFFFEEGKLEAQRGIHTWLRQKPIKWWRTHRVAVGLVVWSILGFWIISLIITCWEWLHQLFRYILVK